MTYDPERAFDAEALDEDATYPEKGCIECGLGTRLRCAGCGEALCEVHEACPNGCDAPGDAAPMTAVREVAARLSARLARRGSSNE